MGSYDGAEICEFIGLYILSFLGKVYGIQNVGLYRDDGLACLHKISGPASDKIRKDMIRTFRQNFSLEITITTNLKTVNFLDVTLNLWTGKYQPYKKPNDTPTYTNVNVNHPPNIIKTLPDNFSKRISNISSDKATFNNDAPFYNDVLSVSEYKENFTYQQDLKHLKKVRQRKIIWFNPPYSVNMATNIGKTFLNLIDEHFPKTNKFHKIFKRSIVKVS